MMITDDVSINCSPAKPSFSVFHSCVFLLVIHVGAIIIGGRTGTMYVGAYLGAEQAMLGSQT